MGIEKYFRHFSNEVYVKTQNYFNRTYFFSRQFSSSFPQRVLKINLELYKKNIKTRKIVIFFFAEHSADYFRNVCSFRAEPLFDRQAGFCADDESKIQ